MSILAAKVLPSESPQRAPRLVHLQILRAFAASLVVLGHGVGHMERAGFDAGRYRHVSALAANMGVTAFFVISGFIMVWQSGDLFAARGGPWIFASRRLIRIVPIYWLATVVVAFDADHRHDPQTLRELLLSLAFLPNVLRPVGVMAPLHRAGWTLNYEMAFYFLFFLCLFFKRPVGLFLLLAVPEFLVQLGYLFHFALVPWPSSLLHFYTSNVILYFSQGVLIGIFGSLAAGRFVLRFPVTPALLLMLPALLLFTAPNRLGRFEAWDMLGFYGTLVVLACAFADNGTTSPVSRLLALLGDASYSTYLVHGLSYAIVLPLAWRLFSARPASRLRMMLVLLACVFVANAVGLLMHKLVEKPIVRALRRPFRVGGAATVPPL